MRIWVGTYGETVLVVGEGANDARVPEGWGTYRYAFQSAALAATFEVEAAGRRLVALSPGSIDFEEGEPLPFETAYLALRAPSSRGTG